MREELRMRGVKRSSNASGFDESGKINGDHSINGSNVSKVV